MTIYNLGSINLDHFYQLPRLPAPGETVATGGYSTGLGGKGANQSVAAARAGARVLHVGATGEDGDWALQRLESYGVDATNIACVEIPTGHAIINVDAAGENTIVIFPGANRTQSPEAIARALEAASPSDTLLLQNETSHQVEAARLAREAGMRVIYSAAPFDIDAVRAVLPHASLLVMNAVEARQLRDTLGQELSELPVKGVVVTRGGEGAEWISAGSEPVFAPAFAVKPVDTTGAGDCFTGFLAAALDAGRPPAEAMRFAAAAAALQVTRPGTADAMPSRDEVDSFLEQQA
ncbi:ribokinase [Defluviimonas sp. 20V17]|uniref:Ribokinase n=1 Tax=Allgaiera indica TaxID=765699 RepID=A0AAN4URI7_9RHOB|nr:ribokinase [Allgaiera indica]KDB02656.1 ribokinase [Defluviimonas sp. 20V17]GHE01848.1 ribokinase [Allgaiera indica]SDW92082.1 ribokinase [Allgaiera indica]